MSIPFRFSAVAFLSDYRVRVIVSACVIGLCFGGCSKEAAEPDDDPAAVVQSPPRTESVQEKLARGRRQLGSGDLQAAGQVAGEILVAEPNNAQAMVLAGQVAIARGDVDGGVEMLDAAADAWPEQWANLYAQATGALWQQNRLEETKARFQTLLERNPTFDDARRGLATLLNRQGLRFDANQQIRVLSRRPGVQLTIDELRCLMVPSRAFFPFSEKPSVDDRDWIKSMGELNVARALYGEGDVRDALKVLEASDVLADRHPAAVALQGQVLVESQQFDAFEAWLAKVDRASRRYPAYWMAMGGWALRQQQPRQAVRMFGEAILREPGEVAAHDRMQQALEAVGDAEAAKRFEARGVQVRSVVKMTSLILSNPNLGPDAFRDLSDLLDEIGRPFEAKNWRSLAAMKSGLGQEALRQADARLRELLAAEDVETTRAQLLCNLDLRPFRLDLAKLMPQRRSDSQRRQEPSSNDGSESITAPASKPAFVNVAQSVGLNFRYVNAEPPKERYFLMHEAVGSGIACLDFDRDGQIDLYVGQGACNAPAGRGSLPNLLARNVGKSFQTVTVLADCDDRGYTLGVTAGDWNQDGFPDLVVGNMTANRLLINQGDGTFREQAGDSLWKDGKYTSSLAIADVNGDQIPDIVEVNYLDDPGIFKPLEFKPDGLPVRFPGPLHFRACPDRIFIGQGDGTMRGQPLASEAPSPGLGLLVTNIDGKGGNDIFVANDMKANHLWVQRDDVSAALDNGALNDGDADDDASDTQSLDSDWVDAAVARGVAYGPSGTPLACMGIAAADFDGNGFLDLHITNFSDQWTNQYMQNEDALFDDLTLPFGLDESSLKMLGFGTEALDFDNNTTIDLMTGNGHIDDLSHEGTPFEMPTQFFVGDGSTLTLTSVSGDPGYWDSPHLTRALVTLDWNRDGRVDVATSDLKEPLSLLENRTQPVGHWLQLRLVGKASQRDAIGAEIRLHLGGDRTFRQVVKTGDGYMSKNDPVIHFGLGDAEQIERLQIRWPDGQDQQVDGVTIDRRWLVVQGDEPFELN